MVRGGGSLCCSLRTRLRRVSISFDLDSMAASKRGFAALRLCSRFSLVFPSAWAATASSAYAAASDASSLLGDWGIVSVGGTGDWGRGIMSVGGRGVGGRGVGGRGSIMNGGTGVGGTGGIMNCGMGGGGTGGIMNCGMGGGGTGGGGTGGGGTVCSDASVGTLLNVKVTDDSVMVTTVVFGKNLTTKSVGVRDTVMSAVVIFKRVAAPPP